MDINLQFDGGVNNQNNRQTITIKIQRVEPPSPQTIHPSPTVYDRETLKIHLACLLGLPNYHPHSDQPALQNPIITCVGTLKPPLINVGRCPHEPPNLQQAEQSFERLIDLLLARRQGKFSPMGFDFNLESAVKVLAWSLLCDEVHWEDVISKAEVWFCAVKGMEAGIGVDESEVQMHEESDKWNVTLSIG